MDLMTTHTCGHCGAGGLASQNQSSLPMQIAPVQLWDKVTWQPASWPSHFQDVVDVIRQGTQVRCQPALQSLLHAASQLNDV